MILKTKHLLGIFLIAFCISIGQAQRYDKDKLKKQREQLRAQITTLSKRLNATKSSEKKSLLYMKQLEKKINVQKSLMHNTSKERKNLKDEIYLTQLEINKLKRELGELKKEYKDVLVNAYKNKSMQNKVLFILSSNSFTEAFRRVKYLEKYSGFQGEKADEIVKKQKAIQTSITKKEQAVHDKDLLMAKQTVLKENMERERVEQNKILAEYRKDESKIAANIKSKEKRDKELQREIQRIIEEEIRIAREKEERERKEREERERKERERLAKLEAERKRKAAELAAKQGSKPKEETVATTIQPKETNPKPTPTPPEKSYAAHSESATLTAGFTSNKGRLPWPVTHGEVVGHFGRQPHPLLKNIYVNNAGVSIAAPRGSAARSVFDGTVTKVIAIPGGNKAVMISHGSYFTVYNNLKNVTVSNGQKVKAKQSIGTVYTNSENNTLLDFQIWKGSSKQNPAGWIGGM